MVAGTAHINAFGKLDNTGNVGGSEVELRSVTGYEGFLTAAFFLGQNVYLALELGVRMNGSGFAENLSALDLVLGNAAEEAADVIAGLCLGQELVEHLNTGYNDGALLFGKTDDLNSVANLNCTTLNKTGSNIATTGDGENVLNRHKEGQVCLALRGGDIAVNVVHEFLDRSVYRIVGIGGSGLKSLTSGTTDDRNIITGEVVLGEDVTDLHLNEVEQLIIINNVSLVHENNDCGNANLTSKKNVLTSLLKRTVGT